MALGETWEDLSDRKNVFKKLDFFSLCTREVCPGDIFTLGGSHRVLSPDMDSVSLDSILTNPSNNRRGCYIIPEHLLQRNKINRLILNEDSPPPVMK